MSDKAKAKLPKGGSDWAVPPRYEVRTLIGSGSYGSVCEAYDRQEERVVAIKKVNKVFDDLVDSKRILREIAILGRLDSPHIVKLYDLCVPTDTSNFQEIYMVLQIADTDLRKLFRTPVFLNEAHIRTLIYNTLLALKYLKSCGIYHRDIKPANCLVNQDCSVHLCDFGLSRPVGVDNAEQLPQSPRGGNGQGEGAQQPIPMVPATQSLKRSLTGHVVTRWYRAPELILLQENYTEQIDVWSIGCIFVEALGMIRQNVQYPQDRGPFFPGSSCFPLSPHRAHPNDYKYHTRGNRDQLNMIFNVLGTPSEEEMQKLEKDDAKRYLQCFQEREGRKLEEMSRLRGSSPEALDLLKQMLRFDPDKRITVGAAIEHDYFADVRKKSVESSNGMPIVLPFESEPKLDEQVMRYYFLKEIQSFHPDLHIPDHLRR